MTDLIYHIAVLGFVISVFLYLLSSILSTPLVRNYLIRGWYFFTEQSERDQKQHLLEATRSMLLGLYETSAGFSESRFLTLIAMLNALYFFGALLGLPFSETPETRRFTAKEALFFGPAIVFTTYISYVITKLFYNRAIRRKSLWPLFHDLCVLIGGFYLLPFLLIIVFRPLQLLMFVTPIGPIATFFSLNGWFPRLVVLPAVLSVCLPSVLVVLASAILYNKWVFRIVAALSDYLYENSWERIRALAVLLFAFCTGLITVISYGRGG